MIRSHHPERMPVLVGILTVVMVLVLDSMGVDVSPFVGRLVTPMVGGAAMVMAITVQEAIKAYRSSHESQASP